MDTGCWKLYRIQKVMDRSDVVLFQKKYKEDGKRKASISLYSQLPDTPEIQHALEMSQMQSEVLTHVYSHASYALYIEMAVIIPPDMAKGKKSFQAWGQFTIFNPLMLACKMVVQVEQEK